MAEPAKQQIGDGQDYFGQAAGKAAQAAKQISQEAAKQAAVKGAEATANAAAATVQAGVEGGKAVAEIAAGTAAGGQRCCSPVDKLYRIPRKEGRDCCPLRRDHCYSCGPARIHPILIYLAR